MEHTGCCICSSERSLSFGKSYAPANIQATKSFHPTVSLRLVPRCGESTPHCSSSLRSAILPPPHHYIHHGGKTPVLLTHVHHTTDMPTCLGAEKSCLHMPISWYRTLVLGLCNGWTSTHTQRNKWSYLTGPGTIENPPYGERSWR